jgi:hypothetical protein
LERIFRIIAAILLAGLLAHTFSVLQSVESSGAYLRVDTLPNPYTASAVGEKFDVNMTIYQLSVGSGCYDAAFELDYNNTVIRVSSFTLASLWKTYAVNDSAGTLQVDVSNPSSSPSGDVLVITIQFIVLIKGVSPVEYTSPLNLLNGKLLGKGGEIQTDPPVNGLVTVTPGLRTPTAVFTWYPLTRGENGTVMFNATGSAPGWNGTGYSPIVNYGWDFGDGNFTSGYYPEIFHVYATLGDFVVGLYITGADGLQANATDLVSVRGRLIGDINGDGIVDILDAILLSNSFLATPGSSSWNSNADLNNDGIVDISDAIILSDHFLEHYS